VFHQFTSFTYSEAGLPSDVRCLQRKRSVVVVVGPDNSIGDCNNQTDITHNHHQDNGSKFRLDDNHNDDDHDNDHNNNDDHSHNNNYHQNHQHHYNYHEYYQYHYDVIIDSFNIIVLVYEKYIVINIDEYNNIGLHKYVIIINNFTKHSIISFNNIVDYDDDIVIDTDKFHGVKNILFERYNHHSHNYDHRNYSNKNHSLRAGFVVCQRFPRKL